MTDLNSISLGGRVTKDATIETTKNGLRLCKFSIAVNRSRKLKDSNEYVDTPTFIDLALYGTYAESMVKFLKKGTYITAEGYLAMDSWISEDGKKHQQLRVVPEVGKINPWIGAKPKESVPTASLAPAEIPQENWEQPEMADSNEIF